MRALAREREEIEEIEKKGEKSIHFAQVDKRYTYTHKITFEQKIKIHFIPTICTSIEAL